MTAITLNRGFDFFYRKCEQAGYYERTNAKALFHDHLRESLAVSGYELFSIYNAIANKKAKQIKL